MTVMPSIKQSAAYSLAVVAIIMLGALAIAAPKASATNFCTQVNLAPYGQGGDRCWGPVKQWLNYGQVTTFQRAGCVDIADGSNNLLASWVCGAAGSSPQYAANIWYNSDLAGWHKAVIRNNNGSSSGTFSGAYSCYNGGAC